MNPDAVTLASQLAAAEIGFSTLMKVPSFAGEGGLTELLNRQNEGREFCIITMIIH